MVSRSNDVTSIAEVEKSLTSLSTGIMLSEVVSAGLRLEAAAFGLEGRKAIEALRASGLPLADLYGQQGFCREAHNAFRFRRIYVDAAHGVPFLSSSDIISMRPEIDNFLSMKNTTKLEKLLVQKWDVMISCSGTVGNVGLAGNTFVGKALSQHAIRLRADTPEKAGYASCFLRSKYGRPQLIGASYGSVVVHIEPSHLERVFIPELHPILMTEIGAKMCDASRLRDEANSLLDSAESLLHDRLRLPRLSALSQSTRRFHQVRASDLENRFEASYHDPLAEAALQQLRSIAGEVTHIADPRVLKELRPITKFRKRVYVQRGVSPSSAVSRCFRLIL